MCETRTIEALTLVNEMMNLIRQEKSKSKTNAEETEHLLTGGLILAAVLTRLLGKEKTCTEARKAIVFLGGEIVKGVAYKCKFHEEVAYEVDRQRKLEKCSVVGLFFPEETGN